MTKEPRERMRALMSRPEKAGRKALKRGEEYDATPQEARDDDRRGLGERVKVTTPAKAKPD
ncbi:hypothetical protein [Puniceibacterium confluentis]|uniref:hypothetical protein n=1 Tax=Puniceibacterium confluentis TaxID=1958944 RepID=UPI0011B62E93|nr:hypothetical protein [Puniceibacterium confluentis]